MQLLRNARLIARLVLVWFALSLGVAVASPLVAPKASLLVCSGASVKLIVLDADGEMAEMGHSALDCPLCAVMSAPPPANSPPVQPPHALSHALRADPGGAHRRAHRRPLAGPRASRPLLNSCIHS
jgi:hypothetical protein